MKFKFLKAAVTGTILSAACLANVANAGIILSDFSMSSNHLSFSVYGTVDKVGTSYKSQIMFGLVDNNDDWMTSYDAGSSSWVEGVSNSGTISSTYSLSGSWTDSILTSGGPQWNIGDTMDISFNFVGVFNTANFDINNFGMSAGLNQNGNIVPAELNLIDGISHDVPEPSTLAIFALGMIGLASRRFKKQS